MNLLPNKALCSVAQPAPLLVQWVADTDGKSQYYRAPGLARKSPRIRFQFSHHVRRAVLVEDAYYKLTLSQVEKLEEVTAELHQMCLKVVEKVIASDELMTKFRIPKHTQVLCASHG